jgi:hypothetical protein
MEKAKNVVSKMSLAAKKAWETRRKNMQSKQPSSSSSKNVVKKKEKKEKVKDSGELKAVEKQELKELNGDELSRIERETQKRLDRRQKIEDAKNGRAEVRAVEVGRIIKKAKIERFNGGVKFSGGA